MAVLRTLVLLGFIGFSLAAECENEMKSFKECIQGQFKNAGGSRPAGGAGGRGGGQSGDRPNMQEMKTNFENCLTSNGCRVPTNGGRAQCFKAVGDRIKADMLQCMRTKTGNNAFTFPEHGPGGHGGPGGEHGLGGPGGFGGHGGEHDGGHGFGGGHGGPGGEDFLAEACQNNAANTEKAKTCLQGLFPQHPQGQGGQGGQGGQHRQGGQGGNNPFCAAKKACEASLGACKDKLEEQKKFMCECGNELQSKREQYMRSEPACANVQQQGGKGPFQGKQRDCNAKPKC